VSFFNELKRRNVIKVAAAYVIIGWLIMQAGEVLSPALHLPDWINSALAFFLILGFPLAMFFAWAFEMTPDGLKKEKDINRSDSITNVTGRKLDFIVIGLLVMALGYFAWDKFLAARGMDETATLETADQTATPEDQFQTIAVLPFVNMSEDPNNEYFSDGLTEELLNTLAKIKELRVAGRTSSFAFKGKHDDLRIIGQKLNVNTILEGSVRKAGNRVRITTQLINVEDGYHLWSETYDRELDDIFAIQEEIARKVAQALRITLLGEDEKRLKEVVSTEIGAYEIYMRAMQGLHEGAYVSLNNSVEQFQQVLALDPAFTPAKLGLVNAWSELANTGAITRSEALRQGLPLLETILAEQPDNSGARIQLALFRAFEEKPEAAEAQFISALEADPRNARGLQEYGRFLFNNQQVKRGMELIAAAVEIEPYDIRVLWDHCQTNAVLQNFDDALTSCDRIREIAPDSPLGYYGWALAHMHTGDMARTAKGYADAILRDPDDYEMQAAMCGFWINLGDVEQAELWQQRADAIGAGQPVPIMTRLALYKYREQHDLARGLAKQSLDRKIENRHGSNAIFRWVWAYESARADEFQAALMPYREAFPWAFETPLRVPGDLNDEIFDVIQIAGLLKLAEPMSDRPTQLLEIAENHVDRLPPGWGAWMPEMMQASIATIRGERQTAINWLNSAFQKNWRVRWRQSLLEDPIISRLADEPGYQELVARFETDMERQRAVAYELMGITK